MNTSHFLTGVQQRAINFISDEFIFIISYDINSSVMYSIIYNEYCPDRQSFEQLSAGARFSAGILLAGSIVRLQLVLYMSNYL